MRLSLCVPALIACCGLPGLAAEALPVTSVVLYSSGVGYVEHLGQVDGNATSRLQFKTGQINDVLKSLIMQDLDGGRIGTVAYPSQDPLDKTLGSFQVDLRGAPSLAQVLTQVRGSTAKIEWQSEQLTGTVVGVEQRTAVIPGPGGQSQTVLRPVLVLLVDGALRQIPLEEARGVTFTDATIQAEFVRALSAVAEARTQERKAVDLSFDGQGQRRVRVGYVTEMPLWKVSYRLVMPDAKAAKPEGALQGWALVDNQTDSDWNAVDLTLVSGRPVSFIQDLYSPRYLPRPQVQDEQTLAAAPQVYGGGMQPTAVVAAAAPARAPKDRARRSAEMKQSITATSEVSADGSPMFGNESELDHPMDLVSSVRSAASATDKQGVLFRYRVPGVTLPRQRSAMLPIVTDPIAVERVSIYNAATDGAHPMAGAWIANTTGKHLLHGPITVFDGGAYAGDARIEMLPPGEKRLLSFAVDVPVLVDAKSAANSSTIASAKLVGGMLWLSWSRIHSQEYRFKNSDSEARTVVLEHPRMGAWKLKDTPEPTERTDTGYRFKVAVPAAQEVSFTVTQAILDSESASVIDYDDQTLLTYATTGTIAPKVRAALDDIAKKRAAISALRREQERQQAELNALVQDQERIRQNLHTVPQNSTYAQKLLTKLNDQESVIEKHHEAIDQRQQQIAQAEQALAVAAANLTLE